MPKKPALSAAELRTLRRLDAQRYRDTWSLFDGRAQHALLERMERAGLIEHRPEGNYSGYMWRLTAAGAEALERAAAEVEA